MTDRTYKEIIEYFRLVSLGTKWDGHIYAVGGCVRDEILGNEIHDVDIAVNLPNGGVQFAKWLSRHGETSEQPVYYFRFGTAKLRLRQFPDEEIELVQTRAEQYTSKTSRCPQVVFGSIEEDAFRRDFTVNTLFRNIKTGEILDLTGAGVRDIREGVLRTPMDPSETFSDDPVRILRALRFSARFGWKIDPAAMEAIAANIGRLGIVSRERWAGEFKKMLLGRNVRQSLGVLCRLGGLAYMNDIMYEMSHMRPDEGAPTLLEAGIEEAARLEEKGVGDPVERLAAVFGNIGMLRAGVTDRYGRRIYPRHEQPGGEMAAKYLRKLGFDPETASQVRALMHRRGNERASLEKERRKRELLELQRRQREEKARRKRSRQQVSDGK